MKQKILLIGLTVLISLSTFAKQVDELTAKMVGQNFLQSRTSSPTLKNATSFQLVYKAKSQNINPLGSIQETNFFYVFNTNANGFIIVAGDDKATPILGYSDQGLFDPSNISPSVAKWLEGYKKQIRIAIDQNIAATNEVSEDWQS
jgi:hypothetical protein